MRLPTAAAVDRITLRLEFDEFSKDSVVTSLHCFSRLQTLTQASRQHWLPSRAAVSLVRSVFSLLFPCSRPQSRQHSRSSSWSQRIVCAKSCDREHAASSLVTRRPERIDPASRVQLTESRSTLVSGITRVSVHTNACRVLDRLCERRVRKDRTRGA